MRFIYSALLLFPLSGFLLAATPVEEAVETAPEATSAPTAVITRLVLRDYQITISPGADGSAQYSIYAHSGQPIDTDLNVEQLQVNYPEIYDSLRPAVARDSQDTNEMILMMERDIFID
ncbi:MAG: hypothetical protein AAFV90_11895 [Cyanobacteria bacterium J06634_5]